MIKKCIICGKEIDAKETHVHTVKGDCCTSHKGSKELGKLLDETRRIHIAILNIPLD